MPDKKKKRRKRRKLVVHPRFYAVLAVFFVALGLLILLIASLFIGDSSSNSTAEGDKQGGGLIANLFATSTPEPTPVPTATPVPTPSPTPVPTPYYVDASNPSKYGIAQHIEVNGTEVSDYFRSKTISFGSPESYASVNGVLCFRGNNYRNLSSFGKISLSEYKMTVANSLTIGSLEKGGGSGSWSGCGWTGQPLIVEWPDEVRKVMNLYDWAKEKEGLVEVIYPTEDGNIYFMDLDTGKETRNHLTLSMPFKGTGTLDPRGYPLLYVGSGDEYQNDSQRSRAMIISLIDGSVLYEFGVQGTDSFAKRNWYAYDSAPLIDSKTDTLIWPAENGVIYTMTLNTVFSAAAGTVSVDPDNVVKFRYDSNISYTDLDKADTSHKWLGYEGSAVAWNGFLYLSSNDGLFQCIDLNTMTIKWVADTWDDTNGSPVLDVISDTEAYLYVGTSLHFTKDSNNSGVTPFFKINAMTGEIAGQYGLTVYTVSGVSGGIQDTAVVGQNKLSDLVYIAFARYGTKDAGALVALYKDTMQPAWTMNMEHYSWSSPTVVYDTNGDGYIIEADSGGNIFLLDGRTGNILDTLSPTKSGSNFEASPAVYGNMMVVGCRGDQTIFFIRLS